MTFSQRVFQLMLLVYPREFRREYGFHMAQVFRDCYRAEIRTGGALRVGRLWLHAFSDLVRTAPREHWDNLLKDKLIMNKLGKDILALLVCLGIIIAAFFLLSYGRKHDVSAILMFGTTLDALVTTGIIANVIIFVLMMATRFHPLRIALWTLLIVHGVLLLLALIVVGRVDPAFRFGPVLVGYAVSFLFWLFLHWVWSKGTRQLAVSGER
jgi:hypothetical protein